jgi:hypothetical protein
MGGTILNWQMLGGLAGRTGYLRLELDNDILYRYHYSRFFFLLSSHLVTGPVIDHHHITHS